MAEATGRPFHQLSAIRSGVKEVREVIDSAERQGMFSTRAVLFIDEIHRFSKSQQDSLLGAVERGSVTLIGATTENPSFEVIPALLSRSQVYVLRLSDGSSWKPWFTGPCARMSGCRSTSGGGEWDALAAGQRRRWPARCSMCLSSWWRRAPLSRRKFEGGMAVDDAWFAVCSGQPSAAMTRPETPITTLLPPLSSPSAAAIRMGASIGWPA